MTKYERTGPQLSKGQEVYAFNNEGKIVTGIVTGVDEGFGVKWSDLEDETDYEFPNVEIINDFIISAGDKAMYNAYVAGATDMRKAVEGWLKIAKQNNP